MHPRSHEANAFTMVQTSFPLLVTSRQYAVIFFYGGAMIAEGASEKYRKYDSARRVGVDKW
jgi:hypothetical protein